MQRPLRVAEALRNGLEHAARVAWLHQQDGQGLWGRYWGSDVDLENLHFEVCYYAPIAWAIERGIRRFDPGAGGSHKRRRGFLAEPRVSLHRWSDPRFAAILRRWLPEANGAQLEEIEAVNAELPFRGGVPPLPGVEAAVESTPDSEP
jgi:predicted N-acyltransferase